MEKTKILRQYIFTVYCLFHYIFDLCFRCHKNPRPLKVVGESYMDNTLCQETYLCGKCGGYYDSFDFGAYERDSYMGQDMHDYPMETVLIKFIKGVFDDFARFYKESSLSGPEKPKRQRTL